MGDPRLTVPTLRVLLVFLRDPGRRWYGMEMATAADMHSGVVYPLLGRLIRAGWVEREDEVGDRRVLCRPLRHYYRLVPDLVDEVRAAVQARTAQLAGWLAPGAGGAATSAGRPLPG